MAKEKKAGPHVSNFDPRVYGLNWNIRSGISTWDFVDKDEPYRSMWVVNVVSVWQVRIYCWSCRIQHGWWFRLEKQASLSIGTSVPNKQYPEPTVGWLYYCSQLFHTGSELTITLKAPTIHQCTSVKKMGSVWYASYHHWPNWPIGSTRKMGYPLLVNHQSLKQLRFPQASFPEDEIAAIHLSSKPQLLFLRIRCEFVVDSSKKNILRTHTKICSDGQ